MEELERCGYCNGPVEPMDAWETSFDDSLFCSEVCALNAADVVEEATGYYVEVKRSEL